MSSNKQYIKVLTKDLKHREYQWKFGLNKLRPEEVFDTKNECTHNAFYVCEIKDFFKWMTLYTNMAYVGYVTIPEYAQIVIMEDKIKTNKVILHEPLIPLVDFIDIAITRKSDIHSENDRPLRWASHFGYLPVVERLIKHGARVNDNKNCALAGASYNGHVDVVECLISHGANIDTYNYEAFRWAIYMGHTDVVECLIKHSSNKSILKFKPFYYYLWIKSTFDILF